MYGMVTKAVGEMVTEKFGEDVWEDIKAKANVDIDVFISNAAYPDDMTYSLVAAASEVLGLPAEAILYEFGRYWVLETANRGYADLMAANGRSLPEFLINLPNFHTRVAMIFPNLMPPRFECANIGEHSLELHYHTHRDGLAPFVLGLLDGLGAMFGTPIRVQQTEFREQGAAHDVFSVEWDAATGEQ
jgi:hypothetical protein